MSVTSRRPSGANSDRVRWGCRTDHAPTRNRDRPECHFGPVRGYQPLPGRRQGHGRLNWCRLFAARAERDLMQPTGRKAEWLAGLPRRKTRTTTAPWGRNQVRRRLAQWQGRDGSAFRAPLGGPRPYRAARVGGRDLAGVTGERPTVVDLGGLLEDPAGRRGPVRERPEGTPRVRPRMPAIRGGVDMRSDPESRLAPAHVGSPAGAASHGVPLRDPRMVRV